MEEWAIYHPSLPAEATAQHLPEGTSFVEKILATNLLGQSCTRWQQVSTFRGKKKASDGMGKETTTARGEPFFRWSFWGNSLQSLSLSTQPHKYIHIWRDQDLRTGATVSDNLQKSDLVQCQKMLVTATKGGTRFEGIKSLEQPNASKIIMMQLNSEKGAYDEKVQLWKGKG